MPANPSGDVATDAPRLVGGFVAGAATATVLVVGGALLLYAGPRVLPAAGALLGLTFSALAAGAWSGVPVPGEGAPGMVARWRFAIATLAAAGILALFWTEPLSTGAGGGVYAVGRFRPGGWTGAVAVLVYLALPAYALGRLLAGIQARHGGVAIAALTGASFAAIAAALLAPRLGAMETFFAAAALLAVGSLVESRSSPWERKIEHMDKVVLVTGVGKKGQVGYAVAEALLRKGARLVISNLHDSVEQLAASLRTAADADDRVVAHHGDLTRAAALEQLEALIQERYGRLDAVVNLAGGLTVIKAFGETSDEEFRRELDRNALTTFTVSRAMLPLVRKSRGAIVNFASPAGVRAQGRLAAYSAAKAAVVALTRALAVEEAEHGVRVNAVAPGLVDTQSNRNAMTDDPNVKYVTREQIAEVVAFLIDDASSGITGETIHVLGPTIE